MISADLLELLNQLIDQQAQLSQNIQAEAHSIWMPGMSVNEDDKYGALYSVSDHPKSLQQAIASINGIEYADGQEGRETQKQKGLILVGPQSLAMAEAVNETKTALGKEFTSVRKQLTKHQTLRDIINGQLEVRKILARAGISRLCINQAKRQLPVVQSPPHRISWLEKRTKSIKRISINDAENMLRKLSSQQAEIDLQKLGSLQIDDLAIVQSPRTPTIKATVFHPVIEDGVKVVKSAQIHAPVPILCATGNEAPRILKGGHRINTQRCDKKISDEVFLPSIRAHMYLVPSACL